MSEHFSACGLFHWDVRFYPLTGLGGKADSPEIPGRHYRFFYLVRLYIFNGG
jgi:hypothetical protein